MATREYIEPDGNFAPSTVIGQESEQLKRLIASGVTDDDELAHRMATSVRAVRRMKKHLA